MVRKPCNLARAEHTTHRVLGGLTGLLVDDVEDIFQRAMGRFLRGPTGQCGGFSVQIRHTTVCVGSDDAVTDASERHAEPLLLRPQFACQAFLFSDVPDDLRDPDDGAGAVADGRCRQGALDVATVLCHPHGLEVLDSLSLTDRGEDVILFGLSVGRNQHADRASNQLRRGVAEEALRRLVARPDDAVQILRQNGVLGRLYDGRQIRLGGARARLLRDVTHDARSADDHAGRVSNRGDRQGHVKAAPVLGDADRIEVIEALAVANASQDLVLFGLTLLWDQNVDGPPDQPAAVYPKVR